MTQLVTIDKRGGVRGLDHKRKGLNLAQFGIAEKERVSDVRWSKKYQRWFIRFLNIRCEFSNYSVDFYIMWKAGVMPMDLPDLTYSKMGALLFVNYENAVRSEVIILQGLQQ